MMDRRQQLRELYGFDFPEHFFRFWDFAQSLRPLDPLKALDDLSLQLVGPFEVLAGRFDSRPPSRSLYLHWRYYFDPPEFFTVLAGDEESPHWGCYLDDPASGSGCVASYYAQDAFEMTVDGDDLFDAVRLCLEETHAGCELDRVCGLSDEGECAENLARLADLREKLKSHSNGERGEIGDAYVDRYSSLAPRRGAVVAQTHEGMGIVVPAETYRPLSRSDEELWTYLSESDTPLSAVEEAQRALREGFPGTALKLGKDLWAIDNEKHRENAYELLDAAYEALGREVLREVLHVHRANRALPSVDILENEI